VSPVRNPLALSMRRFNIVFFGTPQFAASVLEYLLVHGVSVVAVVTQPDRPKGRALKLTPSPVKALILEKFPHIPILQPEKASQEEFLSALKDLKADLFVVVAYGQILSQKLLDIPPLGCINVHTSLLPRFRGAAPIQRAILAGDTETGVVIQKMVRQLDAGDVLSVAKTKILPNMTFADLEKELNELAKPLLLKLLSEYENGVPEGTAQDHSQATYAAKVEPEEGEIHWNLPASQIHNLIRAFSPKPGAWCWIHVKGEKKRLKILRSEVCQASGAPGSLLADGVVVCGVGALRLLEVQPEGKKTMKASDWFRGHSNILFI
jgi:methionyl-tRNA formyltransferase